MNLYRGPEGKARPANYIGMSVGSTNPEIIKTIQKTCDGCGNIFEGRCDHPKSTNVGRVIEGSSQSCTEYEVS